MGMRRQPWASFALWSTTSARTNRTKLWKITVSIVTLDAVMPKGVVESSRSHTASSLAGCKNIKMRSSLSSKVRLLQNLTKICSQGNVSTIYLLRMRFLKSSQLKSTCKFTRRFGPPFVMIYGRIFRLSKRRCVSKNFLKTNSTSCIMHHITTSRLFVSKLTQRLWMTQTSHKRTPVNSCKSVTFPTPLSAQSLKLKGRRLSEPDGRVRFNRLPKSMVNLSTI